MRRFDPRAVGREVEWWRAHRETQYGDHALARSYAALLGAVYR